MTTHLKRRFGWRALDLFCGEGGVSRGLTDAGFSVVGVDIDPEPLKRYPYAWTNESAIKVLARLLNGGGAAGLGLDWFDFIWASCPCQAHSDLQKQNKRVYRDWIGETRDYLKLTGKPYVIENVEGAPLIDPVRLCGANDDVFPELGVIRHRLFESNVPLEGVPCPPKHPLVFTHDKRKRHYGTLDQDTSYVQVTGGGNATIANKRRAMGMPWASGQGCNEAIPPAYAAHIGRQVISNLEQDQAVRHAA